MEERWTSVCVQSDTSIKNTSYLSVVNKSNVKRDNYSIIEKVNPFFSN
jgi:hypothetical protein